MAGKSSFVDKVLGRIGRLDTQGLQTVVQRLARERSFLETLFNTIEDGVLVVDEAGRILYFNQSVTRLLGLQPNVEGQPITNFIPDVDWQKISRFDRTGGQGVVRHEFETHYPRPRFLRLYAAPLDGEAKGSAGVALILHDATEARQQTFEAIESERIQALRPPPPQFKPASLNDIIQRTLELLQPEIENRGLHVKTKLARQLPITPIDPTQIQQVLVNLIKNAMHAMTKGGTLTLQTGEGADGVFVSVADTGAGIPQEQINRIFDPFYTTKEKGTGLGLMIVQRIVRAHGGRIALESHVGRGTTFRLWLPLPHRRPKVLETPAPD